MKKLFKFKYIITLLLCLCFSKIELAQNLSAKKIPNVISFTSVISDNSGKKLPDGNYNIEFSLFENSVGGNPVWSEKYDQFHIQNGIVGILLGKKNDGNPLNLTFDKKYYLSVNIDGNKSFKRIELAGSPYSLGSKYALEVADSAITNKKLKSNSVTDAKIKTVSIQKITGDDPDPYSIYWTIQGNILYGPERNYLGTIEEKDFVFKTFSIERVRFDPYGKITMGTAQDSVKFIVIGKTKFVDVFVKGDLGIGVMPGAAKVHINSADRTPYTPPDMTPLLVDQDSVNIFKIGIDGRVEITTNLTGSESSEQNYPLTVDAVDNGIAVRVDGNADNDNNFVSFWNNDGMKGRIEGESLLNYAADPAKIARDVYLVALEIADGIAMAAAPIEAASIIAYSAELVFNGVILGLEISNIGVTYESGSGDYAEWLRKMNDKEIFYSGDVVGIYNGKISKITKNADQLLCITFSPIVLGNNPPKGKENLYEKVAFLGQVPVKVSGIVHKGDYIITSGLNDGTAISISPEMMTMDEFPKVIGHAWQSSNIEEVKLINTSIGFDSREIVKMLKIKERQNQRLSLDLKEKNNKIGLMNAELKNLNNRVIKLADKYKVLSTRILNNKRKNNNKVVVNK